jgi:hypothetical protein
MVLTEENKRDQLVNRKNEIVKEYRNKMLGSSNEIFERADRAVREGKWDAGGNVGLLDKFKAAFSLKRGETINISEADTLRWGENLLKTQNETFREIRNESRETHNSVLEDLDRAIAAHNLELENLKKRIGEIESKIRTETDSDIADSLIREKTGYEERGIST